MSKKKKVNLNYVVERVFYKDERAGLSWRLAKNPLKSPSVQCYNEKSEKVAEGFVEPNGMLDIVTVYKPEIAKKALYSSFSKMLKIHSAKRMGFVSKSVCDTTHVKEEPIRPKRVLNHSDDEFSNKLGRFFDGYQYV